MLYYSFEMICSVEKSKVGNNLIISLSISIGQKYFSGIDSLFDSLESHDLSLCCMSLLLNLII